MPVNRDQAQMLAALTVACRPHGAPRWDEAGVVAAIGKVKHLSLADVVLACVRAADDRSVKTPGVISNTTSPCWRERATDRPVERIPFDPTTFCGTCGKAEGGCVDHQFVSVVAAKRASVGAVSRIDQLRAERAEATAAHCRHGVARSKCADCTAGRPEPQPLTRPEDRLREPESTEPKESA